MMLETMGDTFVPPEIPAEIRPLEYYLSKIEEDFVDGKQSAVKL